MDGWGERGLDGGVNWMYVLNSLLSLFTAVVMLIGGIVAVRRLGGMGAILMLLGGAGGILGGLFWVGNAVMDELGRGLYSRLEVEVAASVYGAVSMFHGVSWLATGVGVLLTVLRASAMIRREEELEGIRAGQGV